jgi:predicted component of type VI protein secretion system
MNTTYQLVMRTGPTPGKTFPLNRDVITIGRDIANDIVISDPEVSRKHAQVRSSETGFILEDLGSTNGTFVNGQRLVGPHSLQSGELIMLAENVSISFNAVQPDEGATMVSDPEAAVPPTQPSQPQPVPTEQVYVSPPTVQQPPPPPPTVYQEPVDDRSRTWWFAGCGCLVVILVVLLAAAFIFDTLNMYCTSPFDMFFYCP